MHIWYWFFAGRWKTHIGACSLAESGVVGDLLYGSESVWMVPNTVDPLED